MSDLGKAYIQIVPSAQGISGSISQAIGGEATSAGQKAGLNIAGGIGSALKGAAGIMAAGTAAVSTALVKGAGDVASYGDNIDKMSQKMGLTAQSYQEWDAVMQHSGTSMEAMKASMKTLANAAQTNSSAFEALGISQQELGSMSQEQLFEATISALQNVENETERTYLAGKTLGRGATELGALLNTSAEDTQAMRDRVRELGGVMSDDAVKASAQFKDNMQDLQTAISGVGRNLISQLLPSFNDVLAGFTSLIIGEEGAKEKLTAGFEGLFASLDTIASGIIDTLTDMMPNIIEGIATVLPKIIEMAASLIISFSQALVTQMPMLLTTVVPALAQAAVQLVIALGKALIESAPALFDAGVQLFDMFKESFTGNDLLSKGTEMIQGVLDGITEKLPGLLEKGVEILTNIANGIMENIPQLITTAGTLVTEFASFLIQNLPTILQAGAQLILNLVNGIVNNLPQIVASVVQITATFIATIASNLPQILAQGIAIIGKLAAGLLQAIPQLIASIPQIIQAIVNAFGKFDWPSIGKNILEGIKNGILNAISMVIDAAKEAAGAVWDAVRSFFDIGSPSKLMSYAGEMIDTGLANGIADNKKLVGNAIDSLNDYAMTSFTMSPTFGEVQTKEDDRIDQVLNLLTDYLPVIATGENMNISISADSEGIFNAVKKQNKIYKRMNGESAFA